MRAETEEKLAPLLHALKWADKRGDRAVLQRDLAEYQKRYQWQVHEKETSRHIKTRATNSLAKIEALQTKEYQVLFPPTCPKIEPEPTAAPDLNTEIMNALS
jgi:hypothetical protein